VGERELVTRIEVEPLLKPSLRADPAWHAGNVRDESRNAAGVPRQRRRPAARKDGDPNVRQLEPNRGLAMQSGRVSEPPRDLSVTARPGIS
jgi:hypothetical protein